MGIAVPHTNCKCDVFSQLYRTIRYKCDVYSQLYHTTIWYWYWSSTIPYYMYVTEGQLCTGTSTVPSETMAILCDRTRSISERFCPVAFNCIELRPQLLKKRLDSNPPSRPAGCILSIPNLICMVVAPILGGNVPCSNREWNVPGSGQSSSGGVAVLLYINRLQTFQVRGTPMGVRTMTCPLVPRGAAGSPHRHPSERHF